MNKVVMAAMMENDHHNADKKIHIHIQTYTCLYMFILHYMCNETQSNLAGQGCVLTCDQATAVGLECAGHWLLTFGSVGRPCAERYQCSTPAHARGAAWCCALGWSWRFWIHADTWIRLVHWSLNVVDVIGPMTGYDRDIDCH